MQRHAVFDDGAVPGQLNVAGPELVPVRRPGHARWQHGDGRQDEQDDQPVELSMEWVSSNQCASPQVLGAGSRSAGIPRASAI